MSKVFVIAEAGVNHNGSETMAMRLVDIAAASGADAVKFQTFSADKLVAKGTPKAGYQTRMTGAGDQHSMLRALQLSEAAHDDLRWRVPKEASSSCPPRLMRRQRICSSRWG